MVGQTFLKGGCIVRGSLQKAFVAVLISVISGCSPTVSEWDRSSATATLVNAGPPNSAGRNASRTNDIPVAADNDLDGRSVRQRRPARTQKRQQVAGVPTSSVKPPVTPEAAAALMEERYRRQEEAGRRWSKTICSGC